MAKDELLAAMARAVHNDLIPDPNDPDKDLGLASHLASPRFKELRDEAGDEIVGPTGETYPGAWNFLLDESKRRKLLGGEPFRLDGGLYIFELTPGGSLEVNTVFSSAQGGSVPRSSQSGSPQYMRSSPIAKKKSGQPDMPVFLDDLPNLDGGTRFPSVFLFTGKSALRRKGRASAPADTQTDEQLRLLDKFAKKTGLSAQKPPDPNRPGEFLLSQAEQVADHLVRNAYIVHEYIHHDQSSKQRHTRLVPSDVEGRREYPRTDRGSIPRGELAPETFDLTSEIEDEANRAMLTYWKEDCGVSYEEGLILLQIAVRSPAFSILAGHEYESYYVPLWNEMHDRGERFPDSPVNELHAIQLSRAPDLSYFEAFARGSGGKYSAEPGMIETAEDNDIPVLVWAVTGDGRKLGLVVDNNQWFLVFGRGVPSFEADEIGEKLVLFPSFALRIDRAITPSALEALAASQEWSYHGEEGMVPIEGGGSFPVNVWVETSKGNIMGLILLEETTYFVFGRGVSRGVANTVASALLD